jgi:glyoxylase-like metal-dependent hydrolase (beta-lactamase superfamily II)
MSLSIETVESSVRRLRLRNWRGTAVGYEVSAYLLDDVLVDTGFAHARAPMLEAVRVLRPRGVVVTHWHEDHAGNAPALAATGLPMLMHEACEAQLRSHPAIRLYRRVVWGRTPILSQAIEPFDPAPLAVLPAPGHSADHMVVWDAERRILVSGDLFLGVKVRIAHDHESPRTLVATLRQMAALEPRLLLDAHRGVVADGAAQLRAKADWTEEMIASIERLAAEGVGVDGIVRRLFGGESLVGWVSGGEYSRAGFVRAVIREVDGHSQ